MAWNWGNKRERGSKGTHSAGGQRLVGRVLSLCTRKGLVPLKMWQQPPLSPCWPLACPLLSRSELRTRYHITTTPRLVILKPSGEVITDKGRKEIRERGRACFQNWMEAADVFQNFSGWSWGSPGTWTGVWHTSYCRENTVGLGEGVGRFSLWWSRSTQLWQKENTAQEACPPLFVPLVLLLAVFISSCTAFSTRV